MYAPRVLLSEVCGVFTKACLSRISSTGDRRLELNLAEECLARLYELPIQFSDLDASSAAAALKMAVKYHKTINDMTYVELAARISGQWCTADRKFFEALPADFPLNLTLKLSSLNSLGNT